MLGEEGALDLFEKGRVASSDFDVATDMLGKVGNSSQLEIGCKGSGGCKSVNPLKLLYALSTMPSCGADKATDDGPKDDPDMESAFGNGR